MNQDSEFSFRLLLLKISHEIAINPSDACSQFEGSAVRRSPATSIYVIVGGLDPLLHGPFHETDSWYSSSSWLPTGQATQQRASKTEVIIVYLFIYLFWNSILTKPPFETITCEILHRGIAISCFSNLKTVSKWLNHYYKKMHELNWRRRLIWFSIIILYFWIFLE